jgi:hypothetical protein
LTTPFAVECHADEDVVVFLRQTLHFDVRRHHSFSQGDVINDVFVRLVALIGMVDEDPGKPHHRLRDQMQVVFSGAQIELRRRDGRHLLVVKPELEACFLDAMRRVGLTSGLGTVARDLQAILNLPKHPKHQIFRGELAALYGQSRARKIATFVTELADWLPMLL